MYGFPQFQKKLKLLEICGGGGGEVGGDDDDTKSN